MKTNTSMTLYKKGFNKETRMEIWTRYVIDKVMWQGGRGSSLEEGIADKNDVKIFIKYSDDLPEFKIGDIIVKGIIEQEITMQKDLDVDSFKITSIVDCDYGSETMHHYEIGGK